MDKRQFSEKSKLFFSIIIPAHNEEHYIRATLEKVSSLDYPAENYEVIVVENGSSDRTYDIAKEFEKENITALSSAKKGVSIAKNIGMENARKEGNWIILLDCDTILGKDFLKDLNEFLGQDKDGKHSVGTTEVQPIPRTLKAVIWFAFYNFGHRLTKTSYSIQLIKSSLFGSVRFDESLSMGEDLKLIKDARKRGKFFYFRTKEVGTSVRRFEYYGWSRLFFYWIFVAILPEKIQRRFVYKVIR